MYSTINSYIFRQVMIKKFFFFLKYLFHVFEVIVLTYIQALLSVSAYSFDKPLKKQ